MQCILVSTCHFVSRYVHVTDQHIRRKKSFEKISGPPHCMICVFSDYQRLSTFRCIANQYFILSCRRYDADIIHIILLLIMRWNKKQCKRCTMKNNVRLAECSVKWAVSEWLSCRFALQTLHCQGIQSFYRFGSFWIILEHFSSSSSSAPI